MKNFKNHYTYKNNKWLITTAMITLTIFNIKPVQAEESHEKEEEISVIEAQEEERSTENIQENEETIHETEIEKEISEETLNKYNEVMENISPLLNVEQEQALQAFLAAENETTELFKETVATHQLGEFTQAVELYEELLKHFSGQEDSTVADLVKYFQHVAQLEQGLINNEDIIEELTAELEVDEENREDVQEEDVSEVEEVIENEENKEITENELEIKETDEGGTEDLEGETEEPQREEDQKRVSVEEDGDHKDSQQKIAPMSLTVQSNQKTAEELYEQILRATGVSAAWNLAEEMQANYPDSELLEEAVNHAAEINLNYGIKLHNRGGHTDAISYYNRIINQENTSDHLKTKAQAYLKQATLEQEMLTPTDYYNQILEAKGISGAWNLVQEFKIVFPGHALLTETLNYVAELNLNYGKKLHERGEYADAVTYYERVTNESDAAASLKSTAQAYLNQARSDKDLTSPQDYYDQIKTAKGISGAWKLVQEFKENFPEDALLEDAANYVAQLNLDYGKKLHERGEYTDAVSYYERVTNEEIASENLKSAARTYLNQARSDKDLTTPEDYYDQIFKAKGVSGAWDLAQEFKENFPEDALLEEAINHAAQLNLNYGMKLHGREDYTNAKVYYERVVDEDKVSNKLKAEAQTYLNQVESDQALTTPEDYYDQVLNAKGVSGAWDLAQKFKADFPQNEYAEKAFSYAAQLHLDYGMKLHQRGEYADAKKYYDRLLESSAVSTALKKEAQAFQRQANAKQELTTPNDYYKKIQSAKLVSEAWDLAQAFETDFPTAVQLNAAINTTAEMNLNYAVKLHKQGNFSAAMEYYERLFNAEHVDSAIKTKVELYHYLAVNDLQLGEVVTNTSHYNTSLNQAINTQISSSTKPQISAVGGGFRNATKEEVAYYINPNNFLPADSNNLVEALSSVQITVDTLNVRTGPGTVYNQIGTVHNGEVFTIIDIENGWYQVAKNGKTGWISGNQSYVYRNNEVLQFLDLSKPMSIPVTELNAYLKNYGILSGEGDAFSKASQENKINELYLISHALLETGNGTSKLATGILVDEVNGQKVEPKVVYNMFGIGAYDSNPNKFGSERAYQEGWFTPEAAIIGGAKWIGESYIHNPHYQQNTLYEMRWNPANPATHQYATDVAWAVKQTNRILNQAAILAQRHELVLVFDIPQYK